LGNTLEEGETRREDVGRMLKNDRPGPAAENHIAEEKVNGTVGSPNP
jgi:hypothetical protein